MGPVYCDTLYIICVVINFTEFVFIFRSSHHSYTVIGGGFGFDRTVLSPLKYERYSVLYNKGKSHSKDGHL